ncbi:maleylpyruvate isomerase family mycothiol-dependent enzyme [Granulicoccus sp. GXG6511]|uniref:maleylpyruvate isomerase family mycothiol-dependent enzyme n=1 Tax=Granulicoccus sp. GXG6511 TaxID=3381351 RepID=UPI003D7C7F37
MNKTAAYMPADLNRLERETGMIMATIESLTDNEMAAPSHAEGWTRADVVAHLVGNARALGRLIDWAVTGNKQAMYSSMEERNAEIAELAALPPAELKQKMREANAGFAKAADQLRAGKLGAEEVEMASGPVNPYLLPAYRISEIIVHHYDLDTLWGIDEADIDALEDALDLAVARIQKRDDYPGLQIETDEGESYTVGSGGPTLKGGRDAVLGWITRGTTEGLRVDGELPERPDFA